jgi:hypothetical protein
MRGAPLEAVRKSLFCPWPSCRLTAEVKLGDRNARTGRRMDTVRLDEYTSERKYADRVRVRSIDISSNDYLVLEHRVRLDDRNSETSKVLMSYPHLPRLRRGLVEIAAWMRRCYTEDGEFVAGMESEAMKIENMHDGAGLVFQPVKVNEQRDDDATWVPGVRMYVNSWEAFSDTTVEMFDAFASFVGGFDLLAFSIAATQIPAIAALISAPNLESAPQPWRKP